MYPIKTKFRVKKLKKTFHQSVPIFAGECGHDEVKKSRFIMFTVYVTSSETFVHYKRLNSLLTVTDSSQLYCHSNPLKFLTFHKFHKYHL